MQSRRDYDKTRVWMVSTDKLRPPPQSLAKSTKGVVHTLRLLNGIFVVDHRAGIRNGWRTIVGEGLSLKGLAYIFQALLNGL